MRVVGIKSVSVVVVDRPPPDTVSEGRQRRPPIYRRLARQSICKLSDVAVFAPHCETERRRGRDISQAAARPSGLSSG